MPYLSAALVALVLYVSAYLFCVERQTFLSLTEGMPPMVVAHYPQSWLRTVFAPLEWLDRRLRPDAWTP